MVGPLNTHQAPPRARVWRWRQGGPWGPQLLWGMMISLSLGAPGSTTRPDWKASWSRRTTASAAEQSCTMHGGRHLLSIHSQNVSDDLGQLIRSGSGSPVWLGLAWTDVSGTWSWAWADRSPVDFTPVSWSTAGRTGSNASCVIARAHGTGATDLVWEQVACSKRHRYVCGPADAEVSSGSGSGSWEEFQWLAPTTVGAGDDCAPSKTDNAMNLLCQPEILVHLETTVMAPFRELCAENFTACTSDQFCQVLPDGSTVPPQCPCGCESNHTHVEACINLLREMKTNSSCLFAALYGNNSAAHAGYAAAVIEREHMYCPAAAQAIDRQAERDAVSTGLQESRSAQINVLVYVFLTILVGELTRSAVVGISIPPSMFLILEGVIVGWWIESNYDNVLAPHFEEINPYTMFYIFLPGLAFEASYNMNIHVLLRSLTQILLLSIPGVCMTTMLLGIGAKNLLPYDWNWQTSFLFGAIMAATDAVGQQRVLMQYEQPSLKKLGTLVDAECQLDSDMAIVVFTCLLNLADKAAAEGDDTDSMAKLAESFDEESFTEFLGLFGRELVVFAGGGVAVGLLFCGFAYMWYSRSNHDATGEATFSLALSFLSCLVAEIWHMSGLIAILSVGLFMNYNRLRLGMELSEQMRQFWDIVVHMVESLLFISCGLMCAVKNIDMQLELLDFAVLLAIYVMLHVVRAVVVLVVGTISMKAGYGLEFKEGIVVVWAGLTRGAVGLALSLVLASRPTYTDEQKKTNALVLFFCAVITPLTVFLNGGLVQAVICKLGMVYDTPAKQYAVKTAWSRIRLEADHLLETLASETVYGDADWVKIRDNIALPPAESFYTQDAWENVQAIGELLLSPLGFFVSCASSMGLVSEEKTNRSKKAFAIFTPAAVSKPSRASTETREAKENTDAADAAVSPPSNALMNLSNYVSTVSRNKQMFMRLRNAQFQVETRKRIIRLEMTSYLRQYQEGHLARAAVTTLIHDLEHHSDNHKIMSAEDVLGKLKIGSARETLYNWKPPPLAKCLGGGLIKWWAVHSIFQSLTVGFDICVGFMNAKIDVAHSLAEMESHANSLSDDQTTDDEMSQQSQATLEIVAKLKKDVDLQVHEIKKALCVVTAKYPDIMRAVKTRMVSKWLLNTEIEAVTTQFNDEMLDTPDHDKLIGLLKKKKSSIDTTWTIRVKEPTMDEVLQTLPWYAKLSPSAKTALKNIAREIQHQPREYLVQEGENSPSIYILVYGFVEIFHEAAGNVAVQYVGAGTLVGELSLLRSTPCKFSVRTVTATRVCELPGAELLALMDSEPSLEYGLWKICGYRIAKRYLLHNSDMGDDEVSMLDERQSIVTDTVRSSGSQVHDVRKFLMDGSVVRVDANCTVTIPPSAVGWAVLLHTNAPKRLSGEVPRLLPVGEFVAEGRSYIFCDHGRRDQHTCEETPGVKILMESSKSMARFEGTLRGQHTGLRKRPRFVIRDGDSSPTELQLHEHGSSYGAELEHVLGRSSAPPLSSPRRPPPQPVARMRPQMEADQMDNPLARPHVPAHMRRPEEIVEV